MIDVPHLGFIVAAYAVTFLVVAGTVLAVLADGRRLARQIARFEGRTGRGPEA